MRLLVPYLVRWNSLNRSRYYQISRELVGKGHEVHVVQPPPMRALDTGFLEGRRNGNGGVHIHDVTMSPGLLNRRLPFDRVAKKSWYCAKVNSRLRGIVKENHIDAILFYNMALFPATMLDGIVAIYDLGDDHIDLLRHELGRFANRAVLMLAETMLRKTLERSDVVISASSYLKEKYGQENCAVLPNGVSLEAVRPGSGEALKRLYTGPVVGFVGSLEYFVPFEQILDAADRLREFTFVIAGGGRQYEWILKEKEKRRIGNLVVTGGLAHEDILKHIDSFDICLNLFKKNPLTHGACPIKLFEYMAHRKPIVSTRVREVERINRNFLYFADDTEELIRTIRHVWSHPEGARAMGERGYEIVSQNYTWSRIADRFIECAEDAIGSRNAPC